MAGLVPAIHGFLVPDGQTREAPSEPPGAPRPQSVRLPLQIEPVGVHHLRPRRGEVIRERAKRLRMAGEAALRRRLASDVGGTRQVLIESATQGRTEHFVPVAIAGETPGAVRAMTVTGHDGARLTV